MLDQGVNTFSNNRPFSDGGLLGMLEKRLLLLTPFIPVVYHGLRAHASFRGVIFEL
jgi:hypothetical protein